MESKWIDKVLKLDFALNFRNFKTFPPPFLESITKCTCDALIYASKSGRYAKIISNSNQVILFVLFYILFKEDYRAKLKVLICFKVT